MTGFLWDIWMNHKELAHGFKMFLFVPLPPWVQNDFARLIFLRLSKTISPICDFSCPNDSQLDLWMWNAMRDSTWFHHSYFQKMSFAIIATLATPQKIEKNKPTKMVLMTSIFLWVTISDPRSSWFRMRPQANVWVGHRPGQSVEFVHSAWTEHWDQTRSQWSKRFEAVDLSHESPHIWWNFTWFQHGCNRRFMILPFPFWQSQATLRHCLWNCRASLRRAQNLCAVWRRRGLRRA